MKKLILGFVIGVIVLLLFLFFGGAQYVKDLGRGTERAGKKLERYEKGLKKTAREATETMRETVSEAKDAAQDTAKGAKDAVRDTKEKVKDIVD